MKLLPTPIALVCLFAGCALVSGQTVTITNDTTILSSDVTTIDGKDVVVTSGATLTVGGAHSLTSLAVAGTVTHLPQDTNGLSLIIAGLLDIPSSGKIDVSRRGCRGGYNGGNTVQQGEAWCADCGCAPTHGASGGHGASYGGRGAGQYGISNPLYGSESLPAELGSGGASANSYPGGNGGGRIRVQALDMHIDGQVLADGEDAPIPAFNLTGGGGSGGAIALVFTGGYFSGSGLISARGGAGSKQVSPHADGGGGRIAIVGFAGNSFAGAIGPAGTVFTKSAEEAGARLVLDATTVTITNGVERVWASVVINTNSSSTIYNQGTIAMTTDSFSVTNQLTLVQDGVVKGATRTNDVIGSFAVLPGGLVTHTRRLLRGMQLNVEGLLEVKGGGRIDVSSKGCLGGGIGGNHGFYGETWSPCCGCTTTNGADYQSGASYGTRGQGNNSNRTYGSPTAPAELGSGGGAENPYIFDTGGDGGGRIAITAGDLLNDGDIVANGGGVGFNIASAGSGGAIFIQLNSGTFSGAGNIHANGNIGVGGFSGGGRIAIVGFKTNAFAGTLTDQGTLFLPGVPSISSSGTNVLISWGQLFAGFQLESKDDVISTNAWSVITNSAAFVSNQYVVTLSAAATKRYFRITRP